MASSGDRLDVASGMAALSICESLLLAMGDLKIIDEQQAIGVITDAATAHQAASESTCSTEAASLHLEAVAILNGIISGGNSIRHL
jgi:hypothetical protein